MLLAVACGRYAFDSKADRLDDPDTVNAVTPITGCCKGTTFMDTGELPC